MFNNFVVLLNVCVYIYLRLINSAEPQSEPTDVVPYQLISI